LEVKFAWLKNMGLGKKIMAASLLTMIGFISNQIIRFAGNLILTRLLVPEFFGIMGIVTIFLMGVTMFSDLGIRQSVIRSVRGDDLDYLNTAWVIQCLRGLILTVVLLAVSLLVFLLQSNGYLSHDTVYGDPLLPKVLAVVAFIPSIIGMESTYLFLANRRLEQGKIVKIEVVSRLAGLIVMIVSAWKTGSIWSIVAGSILSASCKTFLSHWMFRPNRVRFRWNRLYANELLDYGKWIILASISGFLLTQGDRLLLGGMISPKMLGIYSIAYFLANSVQLAVRSLLQTVFFPVLSDVARSEINSVGELYYNIRKKTDLIVMFFSGVIYVLGTSIVSALYDVRYHEAGWILEVLALSTLGIASVVADQVFLAVGKSKWMSYASLAQMIFMYIAIPISFYNFGFNVAVYVIALSFLPKYIVTLIFLNKLDILSLIKEFRFVPTFGIGVFLGYIIESVIS